jgi:hypothetical protein
MQFPVESKALRPTALAANLLAIMANMIEGAAGYFSFTKAQLTAWTDPLSALADRTSLL